MRKVTTAQVERLEQRAMQVCSPRVPVFIVQDGKPIAAFYWDEWVSGKAGLDTRDPEVLKEWEQEK